MKVLPDIIGTNTVVPIILSSDALWVQFAALGGIVRVGDFSVSIATGIPISAGGGMLMPPGPYRYMARQFFAFIPVGATLSVAYKS